MKKFDLIVFGASGVTGELVLRHMVDRGFHERFSIAIAGRNESKLNDLIGTLDLNNVVDIVLADAKDPGSLRKLAKSTSLLINAVGPYSEFGSYILSACVRTGIDYLDLCGEPGWMYQMISVHSKAVQKSGSRVVFSCGFDSVPFDLGVFHHQAMAQKYFGKPASKIRARIEKMVGGFSDGTTQSLAATVASGNKDPQLLTQLLNPFALCEGDQGVRQPSGVMPSYEDDIDSWVAPFMMAVINSKNVHRTNFLLGYQYGKDFVYDEMWMTGPGDRGERTAKAIASDRDMAKNNNISEDTSGGFYKVRFIGNIKDKTLITSVESEYDPGYHSTAKMVGESVLCLLNHGQGLKPGIYTPASAFGENLIGLLENHAGISFDVRSV